jgi:hypothetical protein
MQMFFSLLALLANVATLFLLVTLCLRRTGPGRSILEMFAPLALPLAFLVALTATGGSLWFSESVGFTPCKLCWYQRIAVFPLPVLLGGMLLRKDVRSTRYLLPMTLIGSGVALWHWLIERVPSLSGKTSCALDAPCSVPWFTEFGFVTLAWMAFSTLTFTTVAILVGNASSAITTASDGEGDASGLLNEIVPGASAPCSCVPACCCQTGACTTAAAWRESAEALLAACSFDEFGNLYDVHAGDLRAAAERFRKTKGTDSEGRDTTE